MRVESNLILGTMFMEGNQSEINFGGAIFSLKTSSMENESETTLRITIHIVRTGLKNAGTTFCVNKRHLEINIRFPRMNIATLPQIPELPSEVYAKQSRQGTR